ncbi:hypothetical protein B0H19DRAFT_1083933 [Mycena capillaripes]|nr:hypothetical protein B0H19DRAFT_1083933 [Mycena capillaripes]
MPQGLAKGGSPGQKNPMPWSSPWAKPLGLGQTLVVLAEKYKRLGNLEDLEASLQASKEAVELTPHGHRQRADRYLRLADLKDLHTALQTEKEAVDMTPLGHPDRAYRLHCLALSLRYRYQRLGDLKDLVASLQTNKEAVDLIPVGHPDRAGLGESDASDAK